MNTTTYPRSNKGYSAQLRTHSDLIKRVGKQYNNAAMKRVEWNAAMKAEPDLEPLLLVGEGSREMQIARLSAFYGRLEGRAAYTRGSSTTPGKPGQFFKGEPSMCSIFDEHRAALEALAAANADGVYGRVSWHYALAATPDVAQAIGYTDRDAEGKRKLVNVLGFWYRTRKKPGSVSTRAPKHKQPEPVQENRQPMQALPQFCSHCGHSIALEALAANLVSTLSSNGLSSQQIVDTLTRAAATVNRMTNTNHES